METRGGFLQPAELLAAGEYFMSAVSLAFGTPCHWMCYRQRRGREVLDPLQMSVRNFMTTVSLTLGTPCH